MSTTTTGSRSLALTRRHRLKVKGSPLTCGRCGHLLTKGVGCVPCKAQVRPLGVRGSR
jgi:hypothetical protein